MFPSVAIDSPLKCAWACAVGQERHRRRRNVSVTENVGIHQGSAVGVVELEPDIGHDGVRDGADRLRGEHEMADRRAVMLKEIAMDGSGTSCDAVSV